MSSGLEKHRENVETCFGTSCNFCERQCPVYNTLKKKTYTSRGKNKAVLGIINDKVKISKALADVAFACTLCGSCDVHCALEDTKIFIDLRGECVANGYFPEAHKLLINNINETGSAYREELSNPKEGDVLFYIGCQYGFRENKVRKILKIFEKFGINVRIEKEICCGYPMKSYGFLQDFEEHKKNFLKIFPHKEVITLCPTCTMFLREDYGFEVKHALEVILEKLSDPEIVKKLNIKKLNKKVTYHDPCHLARYSALIEQPREILKKIGVEIIEMKNHGYHTQCCGGGGGVITADIELSDGIAKSRVLQAIETGTDTLVTVCPTCEPTLKKAALRLRSEETKSLKSIPPEERQRKGGKKIKVKSVWDLVWEAIK